MMVNPNNFYDANRCFDCTMPRSGEIGARCTQAAHALIELTSGLKRSLTTADMSQEDVQDQYNLVSVDAVTVFRCAFKHEFGDCSAELSDKLITK